MIPNPIKKKQGRPSKADLMERERLKSTYSNENQFGTDGSADLNQRSSVTPPLGNRSQYSVSTPLGPIASSSSNAGLNQCK